MKKLEKVNHADELISRVNEIISVVNKLMTVFTSSKAVLSIKELCDYLGISSTTARILIKNKKIATKNIGGGKTQSTHRILREEADKYMKEKD